MLDFGVMGNFWRRMSIAEMYRHAHGLWRLMRAGGTLVVQWEHNAVCTGGEQSGNPAILVACATYNEGDIVAARAVPDDVAAFLRPVDRGGAAY